MRRLFTRDTVYSYTDEEISTELSNRLKRLRLASCVSQSELAKLSGVSLSTLRRAESGGIQEITFGNILKILRAGGMMDGVADLIEETPVHPAISRLREQRPKRDYASSKMRKRYEHE